MNLKKILSGIVILSLAGTSLAFAQDNVLEKARQKYDRNKTTESPANDAAVDAVRNADTPAPVAEAPAPAPVAAEPAAPAPAPVATEDAAVATTTTTATSNDETITVDVTVKVKTNKQKPAKENEAAAESDAPAEPAAKAGRNRFLAFQFVPGLPRYNRNDSFVFALSPVMVSVGTVKALEFGLLLADADKISGVQISALGNFARESDGLQTAGLFNIGGKMSGLQAAGLFNIATDANGLQAAGLFNISGNTNGLETAGLFNIAKNFNGLQAAGLFNIAQDVNGLQVAGLFNGAKKMKGVQLGLVNISEDLDGIAIGLVNYSKNGINEINTWIEGNGMLNAGILSGSRHFYTMFQVGELVTDLFKNTDSLTAGAGIGLRAGKNTGFHVQGDLSVRSLLDTSGKNTYTAQAKDYSGKGWKVVKSEPYSYPNPFVSVFPSLRLGLGVNFGKFIGIFGGVTLDVEGGEYWSVPAVYHSPVALMVNYNGQQYGAYAKLYAGIALL